MLHPLNVLNIIHTYVGLITPEILQDICNSSQIYSDTHSVIAPMHIDTCI